MKTIRTLQILINLLFYVLLGIVIITITYYLILFIYPEILPDILQMSRMAFSFFDWKFFIGPVLTSLNFILFVYGVYLLKKTIPSFKRADIYGSLVVKNLRKSGQLFIFIGLSTILIKVIFFFVVQNSIGFIGKGMQSFWYISTSLISSIDITMISLIVVGLFLLLFSDSFKNAQLLKQENDLTI